MRPALRRGQQLEHGLTPPPVLHREGPVFTGDQRGAGCRVARGCEKLIEPRLLRRGDLQGEHKSLASREHMTGEIGGELRDLAGAVHLAEDQRGPGGHQGVRQRELGGARTSHRVRRRSASRLCQADDEQESARPGPHAREPNPGRTLRSARTPVRRHDSRISRGAVGGG